MGAITVGAIGGVISAIGLTMIYMPWSSKFRMDAIVKQGVDAEAIVQGKETWSQNEGHGEVTRYALHPIFDAERLKGYHMGPTIVKCRVTRRKMQVSQKTYEQAHSGGAVPVTYSRADPRDFVVKADGNTSRLALLCFATLFGVLFVVAGAIAGFHLPPFEPPGVEGAHFFGWLVYLVGFGLFSCGCVMLVKARCATQHAQLEENPTGSACDDGAPGSGDPIEKIGELKQLLDTGALSQAEFESRKAEIVGKV